MSPETPAPPDRLSPPLLPTHGAERLFGRSKELRRLTNAWRNPKIHVVTIVAWGGVGKTALLVEWMARLAAKGWPGVEAKFDWSFYSQGTQEQGAASADLFVAEALEFFKDRDPEEGSAWEKGARLAQLVAGQKTLLVLDGLEPLQYPPGPVAGKLKDPVLETLLKGLAGQNPGLCVVTTRESVKDLAPYHDTTAPEWDLEHLSEEAGAQLLHQAGVTRAGAGEIQANDEELREASREVKGHALTLNLLGAYLGKAHGGDIRKRDLVGFQNADEKTQGGHAFRVMAAYERWLGQSGEDGERQLAVLRLMGLFDRPADPGCLAALREEPAIRGLTEPLVGLSEEDWNLSISALEEAGLLTRAEHQARKVKGYGRGAARAARGRPPSSAPKDFEPPESPRVAPDACALDAHPLLREYFAQQLRETNPKGWHEGHRRLYKHLKESVPYWPEGMEGLQPLYQAVAHGCQAGLHQEACEEVYRNRIFRGPEGYSTFKLGAFGADLGAAACFFEQPWRRLRSGLSEAADAWLLNAAGFRLRALGRPTEALEPMRAAMELAHSHKDWGNAARDAGNLSELELALGQVNGAVRDGEQAVDFADRREERGMRMIMRTTLAHALHQAGRREEALERFREAEVMQAEEQEEYPLLYSVQGFRYCDLLLAEAEREAWRCGGADPGGAGCGASGPGPDTSAAIGLPPCSPAPPRGGQDARAPMIARCREVEKRVTQTLEWAQQVRASLMAFALDHLALGRAALYRAALSDSKSEEAEALQTAREQLDAAVDGLRRAGDTTRVPLGLMSRAWLRHLERDPEGARADLDEAWQIAERGDMKLHMADILLTRARLFHEGGDRARALKDLAEAAKLIEECGYGRREEELADANEAAEGW